MKLKMLLAGLFSLSILAGCGNTDSNSNNSAQNEQKEESVNEKENVSNGEDTSSTETQRIKVNGVTNDSEEKLILLDYINEVKPIINRNLEVVNYFEEIKEMSVAGELYDDEFANIVYDDLLPETIQIQADLEKIKPKSSEAREINEILILMISKNSQAFSEIISFIETGDSSKLTSANNFLSESRKLDRDLEYMVEELRIKYNIKN